MEAGRKESPLSSIVTFTMNPTVDESCAVPRVVPEHKLRCSRPIHEAGGGGLNVARAIRELGGDVKALWACGGLPGKMLGRLLDAEGLDNQAIEVQDDIRINLIVLEETTGQQYRFGMPGPTLVEAEIERCLEALCTLQPTPAYLVLSGSLPPGVGADFYARVARAAPPSTRVVVDTSGEPLLRSLKEAGVFLVKPNLAELEQAMGGTPLESDAQIEAAARKLVGQGQAHVVVVSLGAGGAMVATRDNIALLRSPTVPIRSKVGAGDSMVAGLVLGLARGLSIPDAARFGVAAGAAAVMTPGTRLCRREDVERLYAQMV